MMKDPDEVDRLNLNETRMGREATRAEEIPRSPELQLKRSAKVENGRKTKDRRGVGGPDAAIPHAAVPQAATLEPELAEALEDASKADEIQIGQVEEFIEADQDEDVIMEDDLPEVTRRPIRTRVR